VTESAWPPWPERVAAARPEWRSEALILIPLGVIAVLTSQAGTISTWRDLLAWSLVGLGGVVVGSLCLAALSIPFRTLFWRVRAPRSRALLVIMTAATTGAAFGVGIWIFARVLALDDVDPLWWRILGSAVIVTWFEIAVALSLDARTRLRARQEALIDDALALESARLTTTSMLDELQAEVTQEVNRGLTEVRARLPRITSPDEADALLTRWPEVAAELRGAAAQTVRPLSRRLWESAPGAPERPRPWSLVAYVVSHQPLRPLAVSTLYVLGSGAAAVRESSLVSGIIQFAVGVLIIVAVMGVANAVMRRVPRWHTAVFIGAALLLQVPVVAAYALPPPSDATPDSFVGMLANVIAGLVVIMATSAFGAVSQLSAQRLDAMAAELNREFIEATARSQSLAGLLREAGSIVHGAVQSRILGSAMAIEEAGRNRDPEQFSAALTRALDALENPVPTLGRPRASTVLDELSRRSGLWEGLCEVEYLVGADVTNLAPETIDAIGRITEEAIANAVRHGGAQHVVVTLNVDTETTESPGLLLVISDDGKGPSPADAVAGLGMQLINSLAASSSLQRAGVRTLLTVRFGQV
jgi:hypothetical protein